MVNFGHILQYFLLWNSSCFLPSIAEYINGFYWMMQVDVNWGTGLGGLCLQIAVRGILAVGEEARYTVNWRPQLLCLSKPRSSWTDNGHADNEFLFFTSQLKKVNFAFCRIRQVSSSLDEDAVKNLICFLLAI